MLLDAIAGRGERRTFRDRLTRSSVFELETRAEAPPAWPPTVPELRAIFEPATHGQTLRRALSVSWRHRRELVSAVLVVYLGLVLLAAVIAPLFIEDSRPEIWDRSRAPSGLSSQSASS